MLIGILHEGKFDKKPLQKILTLILAKVRPTNKISPQFISMQASGSILGYIVQASSLFFQANKCDIGVFVSDVDEDLKQGYKNVRSIKIKCKKHIKSVYPNAKYILAFPKPELEEWFFFEEDSIRKVLKIKEIEEIKYNSFPSKERLKKLINEFSSVVLTPEDIYEKIAANINLDKLLQNPSFKEFYDELTVLYFQCS